MSDLVGRKVKHVKLHQPVFVPEYGNMTDVLPPQNKAYNLVMTYTGNGVRVDINNRDTVLLSDAQCAVILFERLAKPLVTSVKEVRAEVA